MIDPSPIRNRRRAEGTSRWTRASSRSMKRAVSSTRWRPRGVFRRQQNDYVQAASGGEVHERPHVRRQGREIHVRGNPAARQPRRAVAPYLGNITGAKEFADGKAQEVAGICVIEPLTVEINLVKPDVLFPIYPFQFMDSGIVAEQGPDWMTKVSAGTGPYSFVRWQRGVDVTEKANPNYWGGAPKIEGIRFLIVPSGDTALSMYDAGELDVVDVPESSYRRVLSDDRYAKQLLEAPRAQVPVSGDESVALSAIPRRARARGDIARDRPGGDGEGALRQRRRHHERPGDARRARLWCRSAGAEIRSRTGAQAAGGGGYPGRQGNAADQGRRSTAPFKDELTYYANQLNRVLGMQVEVNVVERATHIKAMNAGEVAFFPWGWTADYPDAMTFLGDCWYSTSPYNRSRWKNADYDAVIDQARSEADAGKR